MKTFDPLVHSEFLAPSRRHVTTETVVAWLEMDAVCVEEGGTGNVGMVRPFPLLEHPEIKHRYGAWYEWTGMPQQVQITWANGKQSCFGHGDGCEVFPEDEPDAEGPWIDAKDWYLELWLPIAPDTGNWRNPWDTANPIDTGDSGNP